MIFEKECVELRDDPVIAKKNNGIGFRLENPKRKKVELVDIDCAIPASTIKCDFLARVEHAGYFIELKGQDLPYAIRQIVATMKDYDRSGNQRLKSRTAVVAYSRNKVSSTRMKILTQELAAKFNTRLIHNKKVCSVTI